MTAKYLVRGNDTFVFFGIDKLGIILFEDLTDHTDQCFDHIDQCFHLHGQAEGNKWKESNEWKEGKKWKESNEWKEGNKWKESNEWKEGNKWKESNEWKEGNKWKEDGSEAVAVLLLRHPPPLDGAAPQEQQRPQLFSHNNPRPVVLQCQEHRGHPLEKSARRHVPL
ncbi:hypothetical protein CEXT_570621 [Caerostris extrusa]|uniref:Uncharacterized protein n=1 Tax=Caerostris extrusa TaxID=172846 RepID=A0AAV4RK81_CAEEX|nr:hypothetical protein CEXT_570621 [Caerostris extrusa]